MQTRRPVVEFSGSCVGSCARSLLLAGQVKRIRPGTVIAFGGMAETPARMKDQLDAGELFTDDERSKTSRERFLNNFQVLMDESLALRAAQAQAAPLPEAARAFIEAVVGGWRITSLSFSNDGFNFRLDGGRHLCLWWLPDAQGLRQLGLDVPGYQPASRAEAAKLLKVPEEFIYAGPVLDTLPEQPLCSMPPRHTNFEMRP